MKRDEKGVVVNSCVLLHHAEMTMHASTCTRAATAGTLTRGPVAEQRHAVIIEQHRAREASARSTSSNSCRTLKPRRKGRLRRGGGAPTNITLRKARDGMLLQHLATTHRRKYTLPAHRERALARWRWQSAQVGAARRRCCASATISRGSRVSTCSAASGEPTWKPTCT
jgi:hypothetical protein